MLKFAFIVAYMQLIRKFIIEPMDEMKISQPDLAKMIGINKSSLMRNLSGKTEMSLRTYLKICGALELRPYLVPAEYDKTKFENRIVIEKPKCPTPSIAPCLFFHE